MPIQIIRNEDGNCIQFRGSSNPVYWNACLSAEISALNTDNINIINDIKTAGGDPVYEFFNIAHTEFTDNNNAAFVDAQAAVDYINLVGNVAHTPIAASYRGVWDASTNTPDITALSPAADNGDWLWVTVAGTYDSVDYAVNDQIRYSDSTTSWDKIEDVALKANDMIDERDIYVVSSYTGVARTGSILQPYVDIQTAVDAATDGDHILINGQFVISAAILLPADKTLYLHGVAGTVIKYASYDAANDSIFTYAGAGYTKTLFFEDLILQNAGAYGILVDTALKVEITNCRIENCGWSGNGLDLVNAQTDTFANGGTLGYDSTQADLQSFFAAECSDGGAIKLDSIITVEVTDCVLRNSHRGAKIIDCGYVGTTNGFGFLARNQIYNNVGIGVDLEASTGDSQSGCKNFTIYNNAINQNGDSGIKIEGGLDNTLSLGVIKSNWNSGLELSSVTNARIRDLDFDNNNRATYDAEGEESDALATIQIEGGSVSNDGYFIAEILNVQVHNTGLGSNTVRCGILIADGVGNSNSASRIKIDNVGFLAQDYALDIAADLREFDLIVGDCDYVGTLIQNVRIQQEVGYYEELAFSNFSANAPSLDISKDATNTTIILKEGPSGSVINAYPINVLQSLVDGALIDIIMRDSRKIQAKGVPFGNLTISGSSAGNTVLAVNDAVNEFLTGDAAVGGGLGGTTAPAGSLPTDDSGVEVNGTFAEGQDPVGDPIYGVVSNGGHNARFWSTETIDETGEYYTVKITGRGRFMIGLYDGRDGQDDLTELANDALTSNAAGLRYAQAFYNYGSYIAPWTTYGSHPTLSYGPGWNGSTTQQMRYNTEVQDSFVDGTPVWIKIGINGHSQIEVSYYDEGRSDDWIRCSTGTIALAEGEYGLVVKLWDGTAMLYEMPKIHERTTSSITSGTSTYNLLGLAQAGVDPNDIIVTSGDTADHNDGFYTTETISAAGEYFEIVDHTGDFSIGLYNTGEYDASTLDDSAQADSNVGYYFGQFVNDNTFPSHDIRVDTSLSGNGIANTLVEPLFDNYDRLRIGFDLSGRATLWVADHPTDDSWLVKRRFSSGAAAGTYGLLVKSELSSGFEMNITNITTGTLSTTPTLNYRYIESPDGSFFYPLFATETEANYVDTQNGGSGTSHAHVFVDEPTSTTWYMPDTGGTHSGASAPVDTSSITYTEIATEADNLHVPADLTLNNQTFTENQTVNLQIVPQDVIATVTGLPDGLSYAAGFITGTTGYVIADTDYTVSVARTNAYGTNTQTFTITITDNASLGDLADFTETYGNFVQPNRLVLTHDALLQYDTVLSQGQQITYSYTQNPPTIGILSSTGETNLAAFDSSTDTLGTTGTSNSDPGNNFAWVSQWDLRYVTFGGYIGGNSNKHALSGWSDNSIQSGSEGDNHNVEFKLEYANDGYIRLYRGGVLKLTSASTFSGDQTITLAAFDDQAQTDVYVPSNFAISNIGAGSTTPPTGFTDPVEAGAMNSTSVFGDGNDGAVYLTETLKINHRYIIPQTWIEANVLPHIAGANASSSNDEQFLFGVPLTSANWSTIDVNDFYMCFRIEGTSIGNLSTFFKSGSAVGSAVNINSTTDAYYDYALEWDGTDLHLIGTTSTASLSTQPSIGNGGTFSRVATFSNLAGTVGANQELSLAIAIRNGASVELTTSGLQQVRIPWGTNVILVGESSSGNGQFGQVQSSYFDLGGQHAPGAIGFNHPTINAGYTYTYIYHPSMEATDYLEFRLASDNTTVYTTGVTTFDYTTNGDPSYSGLQGYKGITFVVPSDVPPLRAYHYNSYQSGYYDAGRDVPISGSTYVAPVTGVTIEGPSANFTGNVIDAGGSGWISLNETLAAGERLVLDSAFITDLVAAIPDNSMVFFGLKGDTWTDASYPMGSYKGTAGLRFYRSTASGVYMLGYANNGASSSLYTLSTANAEAFIEITSSGDNIRVGYAASTSYDASSTAYSNWASTTKMQTGSQGYGITSIDVGIYWNSISGNTTGFDISDVDWTGLSEIANPTAPAPLTTSWNKALDFSGSAERCQQVSNSTNYNPIMMGGVSQTVGAPTAGNTATGSTAHPWACAIVFNADGHSSNQHIWNVGEGAGSTDDNIYLRLSASRQLFFGWGRDGSLNELYIGTITAGRWYGIYVGHTGERLSAANASSGNLADCFDVKLMSSADSFVALSDQGSQAEWGNTGYSTIGGRMDRSVTGYTTIGGRGSNRSFHGKIASMVITTLRRGQPMPNDNEIKMMIRDPKQWLLDYKVGSPYRLPYSSSEFTFSLNSSAAAYSTQVWLMGDGTSDGYAQMRNQVYPAIQNIYPLNMISMVSNDIQTVNISGLT